MRVIALTLALASTLLAGDDDVRKKFYAELARTYDYLPADVSQDVRDAGVEKMKAFFAFVASDVDAYLPLVREALRDKKQNAYWYFDGAALLTLHSKTKADYELAVDAISRCRLKDVGRRGYFSFTHLISRQDVDAFPIIVKMLEDPKFGFYLPKHAVRLAQLDCVLLCLMCQGDDRWVARLAARLAEEKDDTAMRTILFCLLYSTTEEADAALRQAAGRKQASSETKALAQKLSLATKRPDLPAREVESTRKAFETFLQSYAEKGHWPDGGNAMKQDAFYLVQKGDAPRIRAARRAVARRVSDESVLEIQYLTQLLRCAVTAEE